MAAALLTPVQERDDVRIVATYQPAALGCWTRYNHSVGLKGAHKYKTLDALLCDLHVDAVFVGVPVHERGAVILEVRLRVACSETLLRAITTRLYNTSRQPWAL